MQTLLDQIDRLSLRDKKSLSQKALKACEEAGELAKAVLPYEGAHGTNHRIPSLDKVFEECADIMLVAYSIMKAGGLSTSEMAQIIQRKTDYWEFLLDNEDRSDSQNLDFEIHVTVAEIPSLEAFRQDCADLSVKPIILDLYTDGAPIKDVMTSSRFKGSTTAVVNHTKALGQKLRDRHYNVVREKIETVPWHPAALVRRTPDSAYFEAHMGMRAPDRTDIEWFAKQNGIHLSRNAMKKGDEAVIMGTYRIAAHLTTSAAFVEHVTALCKRAPLHNVTIAERPDTEYSLHDTNERHDAAWIARVA